MTDRTILITGGGSGIGRGLAEAFLGRGNKVVIAGRRQDVLDAARAANPGLETMAFDATDANDIARFADALVARFPTLDTLINNAGVMAREDFTADNIDLDVAERTITTNLLGPIRLTAALLPHLRSRPKAAIINLTSGLAFVPLAAAPTYSATKAAMHSFTVSLRKQLAETSVTVSEIAPPYVQTMLLGEEQASDPAAMPLADFIAETMAHFDAEPNAAENLVDMVKFLRNAEREGRFDQAFDAVNARHG